MSGGSPAASAGDALARVDQLVAAGRCLDAIDLLCRVRGQRR